MKISVVVTVLNEAETIWLLLLGLLAQTHLPDEVIIVDGGSNDRTIFLIKLFQKRYPLLSIKVVTYPSNRSQGRNRGIRLAKNEWIAITDAGCMPDRNWLKELTNQANVSKAEVIAGYYEAITETNFQAAVTPYMLVMEDRVNPDYFLPATRSMMLRKSAWKKVGGFDESLTLSEDYDFAHKLEAAGFKFSFTMKAKVFWWPLETWGEFFQTVMGMARYDAIAGLTRLKAYLVICRYLMMFFLSLTFFAIHWLLGIGWVLFVLGLYSVWAMWKNGHYLDRGWLYLPLLQIVADLGVILGTMRGSFKKLIA